jgi:hypothetical protein
MTTELQLGCHLDRICTVCLPHVITITITKIKI